MLMIIRCQKDENYANPAILTKLQSKKKPAIS